MQLAQEVPVGNLTVTEKATNGLRVSDITAGREPGHHRGPG